jgi:hypothetical protein
MDTPRTLLITTQPIINEANNRDVRKNNVEGRVEICFNVISDHYALIDVLGRCNGDE